MTIASGALAAIARHAVADAPRECCGLLVGTPGVIESVVEMTNIAPGETRYRVDPAGHFALIRRLRGSPQEILGAYHSHPRSAAQPSATDVAEALDANFLYVIVSLAGSRPDARAFRIAGGVVTNVELVAV